MNINSRNMGKTLHTKLLMLDCLNKGKSCDVVGKGDKDWKKEKEKYKQFFIENGLKVKISLIKSSAYDFLNMVKKEQKVCGLNIKPI